MKGNRASQQRELCLEALQGHQPAAQRSLDVHPLPWSGVIPDKEGEERELEEELCVSLRLPVQASLLETRVSWLVSGESRDQRTSAVLVVTADFHVGQPHGPCVPRPVADFEGLVWHLIPGVHQGHGDHAIREGDADEQMPVGSRERVVRVQNVPGPSWMFPAPPGS